ncbi:DNA cytosine methyltransferase [Saccharopolyspora mangrovi]|uniref:DNA (cytosine-5-)-methyltransferase n=1 Tax=Saccharopolyspora mangrovi TaxID=3082379 RepID=A0ABU6A972_9PSEU|nr:DNA cytosine methyltransferase [Saccharopolyspora sp. S2-29]MEB3368060.1 DNA cytosine methyltransferase [Saccharopolyspora sp. S2-29]
MLTLTDLFCGAGGSALGATAVPGIGLTIAANHWQLAVDSHAANFPEAAHDCADISQVDVRRYPSTDLLWASPECTNHSIAQGRKRAAQPDLFGETLPTEAAERSRATMWDVPRFAEYHGYRAIVVENVVDAGKWSMWPAWLHAMQCLGYRHQLVFLNSMHAPTINAPRAPQSRDRLYVVFTREGDPEPEVQPRPLAWCPACERDVAAVQVFKNGKAWGRYRSQYVYRCPTARCHIDVEPYALPAASAIDWSLPGQRIGDRDRPLKAATLRRIEEGLRRYASVPQLVPSGGTWNVSGTPVTDPFRTRTTRETEGLLVPVEGREGKSARPSWEPLRTQTGRNETALVVPYYSNGTARPAGEPLSTVTTHDRHGLAFVAELRGGGSSARHISQPLATVTANGNHHGLVHTETTRRPIGVEDCQFRMLQPAEIQRAMAFRDTYAVLGTRRERVRQLGNAVTPPAAEHLLAAVTRALGHTPATATEKTAA